MFVMRYYKNENLYSYLEESMGVLCWRDIVDMLWSISTGLNFIHELNLIHGHLHGGNILVEIEMDSIDAKITDTGLHGPVDKQRLSQQIYGVVPFVAPEIFNGNIPTQASDIYSFGMIMWMLLAGKLPYCDKPHDKQLIQEISSGLRPKIVSGTPPVFARLMSQCLDDNPLNRPTAFQLYECLGNWVTAICDDPDSSDLSNQFDTAEEIKFAKLESDIFKKHEKAIYYSRPLDMIMIDYEGYQNEIIDADTDVQPLQDDIEIIVQIGDPPSKRVLVNLNLKDMLSKIRERLER